MHTQTYIVGRYPLIAGLSRFDHQVWHLTGVRLACGFKSGLGISFFITPYLGLSSYGFGYIPPTGSAFCVHPPVLNW